MGKRIAVPTSVPGLTTQRLLVMSYIDGLQVSTLDMRLLVRACF